MTIRHLTGAVLIATTTLALGTAGVAQAQESDAGDVSIEDLLNAEVTSVSKKEEQLFAAPAAVYVLTRADIRRSGALSIPDVLRLVPGLSVAQIDGSQWAVTARGFNDLRANKLLVLIDGRSVYSPIFSGVYWDTATLPLEEIERIEVIRGPGATVWGANAVNGVINIISRDSFDTTGGYAAVNAGSFERGAGFVRFGGGLGTRGNYRVYGKYYARGDTLRSGSSQKNDDSSDFVQSGFRADFRPTRRNAITLTAGILEAAMRKRTPVVTGVNENALSEIPTDAHSRNVVASWTHTPSFRSSMSLTASFDDSRREHARLSEESTKTLNVDFQHRFRPLARHDVVWGIGQRIWSDRERGAYMVTFTPDRNRSFLTNVFLQDQIAVGRELAITVGSKFEHHDRTGFHVQPNVRAAWTPTPTQTAWTSVSRAIRVPTRLELDIRANFATFSNPAAGPLPVVVSVFGNPQLRPERVTSYEAGHRADLASGLQVDTAVFYSVYTNLRQLEPLIFVELDPAPAHLVLGQRFQNSDSAITYGIETTARWQPNTWWRLDAAYSWLHADFGANHRIDGQSTHTPAHQWRLGTGADLPAALRLDVNGYRVGRIASLTMPAYTRIDARLNHELSPRLSLAIVAQNLLDGRHAEFVFLEGGLAGEIPRSAYLRCTWQF